jgi:hypothetical protein
VIDVRVQQRGHQSIILLHWEFREAHFSDSCHDPGKRDQGDLD